MKTVKNLLGYIGCICITVMVAYFIDGTAGIILTAAMICAFVISLAVTLVVRRFLKVEISLSRDLLGKGDSFLLNVNISKNIIIPAPVVKIKPQIRGRKRIQRLGSRQGGNDYPYLYESRTLGSGGGQPYKRAAV